MRWFVVVAVLLTGCPAEDDYPYRPPGHGGNTMNGDPPDAAPGTADAAVPGELTGRVCVVQDFSAPFDCANVPLARDVEIVDVETGLSTVSGSDASFAIDLDAAEVVLLLGNANDDLLMPTLSVQDTGDSPVDVPVVEEALWSDTLIALLETQSTGAGVVFVVDANGPVPGATVAITGGGQPAARLYYDDGAGGFDASATVTDLDGAALLLDVTSTGVTATADDGRSAGAILPTASLAVGVVVITLPEP